MDETEYGVSCARHGSVLIRDPRAWHGGTPNLSNEVRAIPSAEFYALVSTRHAAESTKIVVRTIVCPWPIHLTLHRR